MDSISQFETNILKKLGLRKKKIIYVSSVISALSDRVAIRKKSINSIQLDFIDDVYSASTSRMISVIGKYVNRYSLERSLRENPGKDFGEKLIKSIGFELIEKNSFSGHPFLT